MKIGISADKEWEGFSTFGEYMPKEPLIVDASLPPEVERALNLIDLRIPTWQGNFPVARYIAQGHGDEYGLVFRMGENERILLVPGDSGSAFEKRGLTCRISYGMPAGEEIALGSSKTVNYNDPSKISRLHLSVFGWRDFPLEEGIRVSRTDLFRYFRESVHVSLRWTDGKFDSRWSDPAEWFKQKDSDSYNRARFDEMRTPYVKSMEMISSANGAVGKKITVEEIEKLIGSGKARTTKNLSIEEFLALFPAGTTLEDAKKAAGIRREIVDFPNIGYAPALKLLSQFGNVSENDANEIPYASMESGVNYLFSRVLPAVERFTKL